MKKALLGFSLALLAAPSMTVAQQYSNSSLVSVESITDGGSGGVPTAKKAVVAPAEPFSQLALGVGVSSLGIGLQAATNINQHFNIRGTGNIFKYSTDFTTNGFKSNANLNLASAGVALDVYPFHAGFRLSPGVLFYNDNGLTATSNVAGGTSFTLNHQDFYSDSADPAKAIGTLALNTTKPAFTITTGWGNMIPRKGHLSIPFEIGVAVTGAPLLAVNLTGSACIDHAQTECSPISGNSQIATEIQTDLTAQVAKWNSDLNQLKIYPILSVGVAYSFRIR
jgi:hypothetical protein